VRKLGSKTARNSGAQRQVVTRVLLMIWRIRQDGKGFVKLALRLGGTHCESHVDFAPPRAIMRVT